MLTAPSTPPDMPPKLLPAVAMHGCDAFTMLVWRTVKTRGHDEKTAAAISYCAELGTHTSIAHICVT